MVGKAKKVMMEKVSEGVCIYVCVHVYVCMSVTHIYMFVGG